MNDKSDINQTIHVMLDLLMHLGIKDAGKDPSDPDGDRFFIDAREINGFLSRHDSGKGADENSI